MTTPTPADYRRERIRRGYTQAQLAEAVDVDRVTIAKRESGTKGYPITREAWLAICSLPKSKINHS